jgi:NAD-dependent dihydropyrimidine dehydrogenase PreA subunit
MSLSAANVPTIHFELCLGFERCGACGAVCPEGAIRAGLRADEPAYAGDCSLCAACEDVCPAGAISVPFAISNSNSK